MAEVKEIKNVTITVDGKHETPTWKGRAHRCHHPIRMGDRLYTSYWHGGAVILDISDMTKPKCVGAIDTSPPIPWPTHSCVPIPFPIAGRRWMLVADEDVLPLDPKLTSEMPAFMWMMDITDETRPMPVGSFQVDGVDGKANTWMTGCHQPIEDIKDTEVPFAWFAQGFASSTSPTRMPRGGGKLHAGRCAGRGPRVQQRRVPRSPRSRLCRRPHPRLPHRRADLTTHDPFA